MKNFQLCVPALVAVTIISSSVYAEINNAVDWSKRTVTVKGVGIAPNDAQNPTQRQRLAEIAAKTECYRQLAELVGSIQVTGETTVSGIMTLSDTVTTKVNAVIQGARVVNSKPTADGAMEVTMQMPLFGNTNSLAGIVLERPSVRTPFPAPVHNVAPTVPQYNSRTPVNQRIEIVLNNSGSTTINISTPMSSPIFSNVLDLQTKLFFTPEVTLSPMSYINISGLPKVNSPQTQTPQIQTQTPQIQTQPTPQIQTPNQSNQQTTNYSAEGDYTGLIVDCRGLNLQPVMSPVIKNANAESIYGHQNLDYDKVIELGMAAYTDASGDLSRAGNNPIVVRAISLDNFNSNPVVSVADSNRILLENQSSKFLDDLNVVFLQ